MDHVLPFTSGGSSRVNSFRLVSSGPRSRLGVLSRMERMACVAHALLMTWLAKNTSPPRLFSGTRSSFSCRHLKRKMRPWIGLGSRGRGRGCQLVSRALSA